MDLIMNYRWLAVLACVLFAACTSENETNSVATPKTEIGRIAVKENNGDVEKKRRPLEDVEKTPLTNPAAELAAQHLKEVLAWQVDYRKAAKEDRAAVLKERPSSSEYSVKFKKLANAHAGTKIAASALAWMAVNASEKQTKATSFQTLIDSHVDDVELCDAAVSLSTYGTPSKHFEDQLKTVMDRTSNKRVKAAAGVSLIRLYDKIKSISVGIESNPAAAKRLGKELVEFTKNFSVENSELETIYGSLSKDCGDVSIMAIGRKIEIGKFAESGLFKLKHLSLGCVAPEIAGKDLDGVEFKLSEYRGQVVLLDFWGDW